MSKTDIIIAGTGMVGTRQITYEVEAALEKSEEIFLIDHQPNIMDRYLEDNDAEVTDLSQEYEDEKRREEIYEEMAQRVLDAGERCDDPVTLALYGHPFVFVSPSRWIAEEAPSRGLTVEKLPGISSMDCIYADIELDPGASGIQMYEATDLLLREYYLNTHVPVMIWQIGAIENIRYSKAANKPERFSRIREYLQQHYPDDHEVTILQTAIYPFTDSKQISFKLSEFESMAEDINSVQTLYVPPVGSKDIENDELASSIEDAKHLETITVEGETQSL